MKGSIVVEALAKHFGTNRVLRRVSLSVKPGECLGIVGANGSGKTTLIKIVATILSSSKGRVSVSGFDIKEDGLEARARTGLISHHPLLYEELTAMENLLFFAKLHEIPSPRRVKLSRKLLKKVGLGLRENDIVGTFSRGMVQRLAIARAFLGDPEVLLLDEPFASLDQAGMRIMKRMVEEHLSNGGCALLTSHMLDRIMEVSTSIMILESGKLGRREAPTEATRIKLEKLLGKGGGR